MADARRDHLDPTAVVLVVGCCVLWGLNQVAAKAAIPEIGPMWQAAARSVGGALLVAAWARARGVRLFKADGTARGGLLAGTLFAAEFACIFIGLETTTAVRMVVFVYLAPFVVALGMPFIARSERLRPVQAAGLVLAFAGVGWAFSEGFGGAGKASHVWDGLRDAHAGPAMVSAKSGPAGGWVGDALGVAAGVIWGATTLTVRATALARAPAEKTLLWQLAVSGVLLTLLALWRGGPLPLRVSALAGVALAFQVVIVTAISYLVWFWLIRRYPATRLSAFTLLTPVFGLVFGGLLLSEPITDRLIVAVVGVTVGIVLVNRQR